MLSLAISMSALAIVMSSVRATSTTIIKIKTTGASGEGRN